MSEDTAVTLPELQDEALYILPQEDVIELQIVLKEEKTTEISDRPSMVWKEIKIPLYNSDGSPMLYEEERVVSQPVEVPDGNGGTKTVYREKVIKTGNTIHLSRTTAEEVIEEDEEGNALYWHTIEEEVEIRIPQSPILITKEDPRWTEELEIYVAPPPPPPTLEERVRMTENRTWNLMYEQEELKTNQKGLLTGVIELKETQDGHDEQISFVEEENAMMLFSLAEKEISIGNLEKEKELLMVGMTALEEENAMLLFQTIEQELLINQLEEENAMSLLHNMEQDLNSAENEEILADLIYQLTIQGVLSA